MDLDHFCESNSPRKSVLSPQKYQRNGFTLIENSLDQNVL